MKHPWPLIIGILSVAPIFAFVACCGSCAWMAQNPASTPTTYHAPVESPSNLAVEIENVRLEPFHTATGFDTHSILVDWKNTGKRSVRGVKADMQAFDDDGNEVFSVKDYYIYAGNNDGPGIAPGQSYSDDDGHIVLGATGTPVRATARITKVEEKGY